MTAQSFSLSTLAIPDPHLDPTAAQDTKRLNSSYAYPFYVDGANIRTLSTNAITPGNDVTGLLYTPDLARDDPCDNASHPYLPANVTRRRNLPDADYDLVSIAPWISPACVQSYLAAARRDNTVQGFLFFIPGDYDTTVPPLPNSNIWSLGDGGSWKSQNNFPVYALPGANAQTLLAASALYSRNLIDVPFGPELARIYDPRDFVRLFVDLGTQGSGSTLPSLWVFLLVVLGILLAIVGLTSSVMHWLQNRRRNALRRRVANGEVDLEALGIKRLTVPQEMLDQMPVYIYGSAPLASSNAAKDTANRRGGKLDAAMSSHPSSPLPSTRPTAALSRSSSFHPTPLQQPTCPICLDDFVPAGPDTEGVRVRELPCHHIYHPECVDAFLRDNSSLCPVCKRTALPKGYCPRNITNAMVRRERLMQQPGYRNSPSPVEIADAELGDGGRESLTPLNASFGNRLRTFSGRYTIRSSHRISSAPSPAPTPMTELTTMTPALARSHSATITSLARPPPQRVQPPSTPSRREWARQRAVDMIGRRAAALEDPDAEEARTTARWRKAFRGVFPATR